MSQWVLWYKQEFAKWTDSMKAFQDEVNLGNAWSPDTEHHTKGAASQSGVCLLTNLVFPSVDSGEAQEGTKQSGTLTRSAVRRWIWGQAMTG